MNILEAAKISSFIQRRGMLGFSVKSYEGKVISLEDALADDWEPVVEKITITKEQLLDAMSFMFYGFHREGVQFINTHAEAKWLDLKDEYGQHVANQLGFKE